MHEARIEETTQGRLPADDGWFILNLGEMPWETIPGYGVWRGFDWANERPGVGVHVHVLQPGETNGYYHAEEAQEGFIVLSGECLAIVEGEERRLRAWDFVHCPGGTAHIFVGAGDGPCVIFMAGARAHRGSGAYTRSEAALRHGAGVETETAESREAYAPFPKWRPGPPASFDGLPFG